MPRRKTPVTSGDDVIALKALTFLAANDDRFQRFIGLTGLTLDEIRNGAAEPRFLAAVMNYLRADQSLLLTFAEQEALAPADVDRAGLRLSGEYAP
jgi:hypothetical protein